MSISPSIIERDERRKTRVDKQRTKEETYTHDFREPQEIESADDQARD